jgi:alkylation response protein AidB-like acyl-CoA dehydrogenase
MKGSIMAQYHIDQTDLNFVLFDWLKIQDHMSDLGENDLKDIVTQLDNFVEKEVWPTRLPGDEIGVKLENGKVKVPEIFHQTQKQFYENGWFALGFPEEIGGMPVPESLTVAATQMIIGANPAFNMYYGLSKAVVNVIRMVGSDEQKGRYIENLMAGTWGGTMCLTEPGAGSDVGAAKTTAEKMEDGRYKIKGTKIFISSGDNDLYDNIIHLVLARTKDAPQGTKGLSLFIVPKNNLDTGESNKVVCTKIEEKMGMHGSCTCEMIFGHEGDCYGELIGEELDGMKNMFIMMNEARLLCGVQGDAQASMAYNFALQYAKERAQFGTEIINLPDVKRMLLKMRAMTRGLKALNLYVSNLFDKAKTDTSLEDEIAFFTPICKSYSTDEGFQTCVDAVQVHGGYGYCSEYGVEQFVRDSKIATIYEGTNGIQSIDFVTRKILRDGGKTITRVFEEIGKSLAKGQSSWSKESALLGESLQGAQKILESFGAAAKAKNEKRILDHCTDFLNYCGNIVVSWLLLDMALKAGEQTAQASGEDLTYLNSKIEDFQVFSQHYLVRNKGIYTTIMGFEE